MKLRITMFISAGLMATGIASAATTSNLLNVSTTIGTNATCAITATNAISFPWVDNQTDTNANGSIGINCTNGVQYSIGIDAGLAYDSTYGTRQELDVNTGTNVIPYDLFKDAGYSTPWGDDNNTIPWSSLVATANGNDQTWPVYGIQYASLLGQKNVNPQNGAYSDVVNVIVTY